MKSLLLLMSSVLCLFGQVDSNSLHMKYGQPVEETFTIRPGIILSVTYGDKHEVCKLGLRPNRNGSVIPVVLIEELLNEIVPPSTRGIPRTKRLECFGFCWKTTVYERVRIGQSADDLRPSSQTETNSQNSLAVIQFKSCEAVRR
jgi:hypothetical protein